jgi:hypothetical protein
MAEDTVQIVLPPDASPDLIERVRDAFPEAVADLDADIAPAPAPGDDLAEEVVARAVTAAGDFPAAFAAGGAACRAGRCGSS